MDKKNYLKPNLKEVKIKQHARLLGQSCGTDFTPGGGGNSRSFNLDEEDY